MPPPSLPKTRRPCGAALALTMGFAALLAAAPAQADLIARFEFGGDLADTSGSPTDYGLTAIDGGPDTSLGFARFDGSGAYAEVLGPSSTPEFTVSLWLRSQGSLDQGSTRGIFSNNFSPLQPGSWQIDSTGGEYLWRNQAGTFSIGTPSALGEWDHIVIRKFGGSDGDIWWNGVQVVSNLGANPGGLFAFRLGTNRNSVSFWQGDLADVRVYDSLVDPGSLFAAAPAALPEPDQNVLLAVALLAVAAAVSRAAGPPA